LRQEAARQAREAEERRLAKEAEERRLAQEAEERRIAAEAEARRQAAAEVEAKRVAEERARQAAEAEARRQAEAQAAARQAEAEAARQAEERARQAAALDRLRAEKAREQKQAGTSSPALPLQSARRKTLIGRADYDNQLLIFAEVWRRSVNTRAPFEVLDKAKKGNSYQNPWVTVALRADGQVESITFERSSGVPEIDAAIRQVIMMLAPYNRFPRELAAEYDIIEVPAIWSFNRAVRLFWGGG
jgi:TolA protein